jgi:hypothetical protein
LIQRCGRRIASARTIGHDCGINSTLLRSTKAKQREQAGRKALKPSPTKQANCMVWRLVARVPLHFAA